MLKFSVLLFSSMFCLSVSASENNLALQDMFESDQAERSEENMAQGIFPSFADEIGRRLFVFEAMSKGELTSADEHRVSVGLPPVDDILGEL
ncbi:MAG: hypothetical protein JJU03_00255 [Idiomarina sp.]|nr:hypothetical protein [Idiomarina sp.]